MSKILTREQCLSVFKHATYPDWVTGHPSILKANIDALYERVRVLEEQAPMDAYEKLDAAEAEVERLTKERDEALTKLAESRVREHHLIDVPASKRVAALERLVTVYRKSGHDAMEALRPIWTDEANVLAGEGRDAELEQAEARVAALEKALREIAGDAVASSSRRIARAALEREEKK